MASNPDQPSADRSPRVEIEVNGTVYDNVKDYSWASEVLTLGDDFACTIGNDDGIWSGSIRIGQTLRVFVADPDVSGGQRVPKLTGLVTHVEHTCDMAGGSVILVQGADLGWHLNNSDAPLWMGLQGITYGQLLAKVIDPSWGFAGTRGGNLLNRNLRQGRAGIQQQIAQDANYKAFIPPIQVQVGQTIAQLLIDYARRAGCLVNVSGDGWLQVFQPDYTTPTAAKLELHKSSEPERARNNVLSPAHIVEDIGNVYSRVVCEGSVVMPSKFPNAENPNEGKFRGQDVDPGVLSFARTLSFCDGERLSVNQASKRARWRRLRGLFDAWVATYTVVGHSQGGKFFEADTMIEIDDTVNNVRGNFYVSGVRYNRDLAGGTRTTLTVHKPGLLAA